MVTEKKEMVFVGIKMPKTLKELIKVYLEKAPYQNLSEFVRDAVRKKIMSDAPDLYSNSFKRRNSFTEKRR